MLILGIESSCDETAAAVLKTPKRLLSNHVASQENIHARFGGIVPELASRRHMEVIVPLFNLALESAGVAMNDIDGIAVTAAPGLVGSLLVGLSFAKSLAYVHKKPIKRVNHLEGHLNAAHLEYEEIPYPHIGMVVSGGHTSLYLVTAFGRYKLLGATRDDAAGEAYDKVAKLLGLGYPGGPIIDKIAKTGNPKAFKFTKPKISAGSIFEVGEFDFSFSGIKTAVRDIVAAELALPRLGKVNFAATGKVNFAATGKVNFAATGKVNFAATGKASFAATDIADIAASFQQTVINILCKQIVKACHKYKCKAVVISGGVAANSGLRAELKNLCNENNYSLFIPGPKFCTDNAAMIAYTGGRYLEAGEKDGLDLSAAANEEIGVCI